MSSVHSTALRLAHPPPIGTSKPRALRVSSSDMRNRALRGQSLRRGGRDQQDCWTAGTRASRLGLSRTMPRRSPLRAAEFLRDIANGWEQRAGSSGSLSIRRRRGSNEAVRGERCRMTVSTARAAMVWLFCAGSGRALPAAGPGQPVAWRTVQRASDFVVRNEPESVTVGPWSALNWNESKRLSCSP